MRPSKMKKASSASHPLVHMIFCGKYILGKSLVATSLLGKLEESEVAHAVISVIRYS